MSDCSWARRRWLWRNGYRKCAYCGLRLTWKGKHKLTADHVIPRSRGGTNKRKNLKAACYACNQEKGASYWVAKNDATRHIVGRSYMTMDQLQELSRDADEAMASLRPALFTGGA